MYSIRITSTLFLFGLFLAVGECATGAGVSVKSFGPSSRVLNIRLEQAVERALQNHVLVQTAREKISESRGVWAQTMADLLPQLNSSVHQQRVWHVNMATLGFPAAGVVGPFNAFDARLTFTQKIFDLSAVARSQQGMVGVDIATLEEQFTRQKVRLAATLTYLEGLRAYDGLKAAMADLNLANRLLLQAVHQRDCGIATGVDVARSRTRRAQEKLRLAQARYLYHESMIKLARVMVLPMETKIRLADSLDYFEERPVSAGEAITLSEKTRLEIRLSQQNVRLEKKRLDEARFQYFPKVEIDADYGSNGPQLNQKKAPTGQGMILGRMPIFEGGMIQGQVRQATSRVEQSQMAFDDVGRQVEEDVRLALRRLETGKEKVLFASQALTLAKRELVMTQDRFASGVSDNVEVLSSQTALTGARDDYLAALADYHASRMNLYWALGQPEAFNLKSLSTKEK